MSRLQVGRLSLQCSMEVLVKAISNLVKHPNEIRASDQASLEIKSVNMDDRPGEFNIIIPDICGISNADIGLKREKDNSWTIKGDQKVIAVQNAIIQEVCAMRMRAIAEIKNLEIIKDEIDGADKVIRIRKKIEN